MIPAILAGCQKWEETESGTLRFVTNKKGPVLGYSSVSGVNIITDRGYAFKDLNKNGELDAYEDWRLPVDDRAADLASKLSVEEIAGLMLYSGHQSIPSAGGGRSGGVTYNGKPFAESGALPSDLSDAQIEFFTNDNLRHVLIPQCKARRLLHYGTITHRHYVKVWDLAYRQTTVLTRVMEQQPMQSSMPVPVVQYPCGRVSGHGCLIRPFNSKGIGKIASVEYRALGIATALSPQIDIATDPRWGRVSGTFGEDPKLSADMARSYVDGFQTSEGTAEISGGWGYESVNAMIKHWPGGGSGEGGRDAHYGYGKYAIFPGDNLADPLVRFTEGAFRLEGPTGMASAVMPYYTISFMQDKVNNENVGNSYSKYIINDLLRGTYNFQGVVCTDWGITNDETAVDAFSGRPWGVETLSVAERHYKIIMAGVDQFGGNNDAGPVLEAYQIGVNEIGEEAMRARMEQSALRLLRNIFRVGLFENPYLDVEKTRQTVGNPDFMAKGYEAQLKSIVMVKNHGKALPLAGDITVYIPKRFSPGSAGMFGGEASEGSWNYPVNIELAKKYFNVTDNPDEADVALVMISSPSPGSGYSAANASSGGNGYVPMTLQYSTYRAEYARDPSFAGGDPLEKFTNRTFKNKTVTASNSADLNLVLDTYNKMKGKPVIVSVTVSNPMVFSEFESKANAIILNFRTQDQAILDVITGKSEPSGLLPLQMPLDMKTVEQQFEDVPHDMQVFVDSDGNSYDFGFGLNWSGVI